MERITEIRTKIGENNIIIEEFEPLEGIAILKELLTRSLPINLLGALDVNNSDISSMFSGISKVQSVMDIDEFTKFERRLLTKVYLDLPAGKIVLYDERGNMKADFSKFEILDILIKVVKLNYESFFLEMLQKFKLIKPVEQNTNGTDAKKETVETVKTTEDFQGMLSGLKAKVLSRNI